MNENEKLWHGEFGRDYHYRNAPYSRVPMWENILKYLDPKPTSAIELGCGKGENLAALFDLGVRKLTGIEVNPYAAEFARNFLQVPILETPVLAYKKLGPYDMALTRGFLIHVPEDQLDETLALLGTAKRYVVMIEYHDGLRREIEYHGKAEALWADSFSDKFLDIQARKGNTWEVTRLPTDATDGTTTHIFRKLGVE
jgi:SAM-dependent methyltransferase